MSHAPTGATFATLTNLDAQLVRASKGTIKPLTAFWARELKRFYEHPTAKSFVASAGRGSAKSHTSAKVALNELLSGSWAVPRGEMHWFAFVSVNKTEAAQRLKLLREFLDTLRIAYDAAGDSIALRNRPVGFRVFAAEVGGVSGFRCFGYALDEAAKLEGANSVNPAAEIAASLDSMTITHANARRLLVSSPWDLANFFQELHDRGDTDTQVTCHAASWEANPDAITLETARAKSQSDQYFLREYAAIPGNNENTALDAADVLATFARAPGGNPRASFIVLDPATLKGAGDRFTYALGHEHANGTLSLSGFGGSNRVTFSEMTATILGLARRHGVKRVYSDQREEAGLKSVFERAGLHFTAYPWSEPSKAQAVQLVRRAMREGALALAEHAELKRELLGLKSKLSPSGRELYPLNGRDYASLIVSTFHGVAEGAISCAGALPEHGIHTVPGAVWDQLARDYETYERTGHVPEPVRAAPVPAPVAKPVELTDEQLAPARAIVAASEARRAEYLRTHPEPERKPEPAPAVDPWAALLGDGLTGQQRRRMGL